MMKFFLIFLICRVNSCSVNKVCKDNKIESFRIVINNGAEAGQEVFHIHIHILSGRKLNWPPG